MGRLLPALLIILLVAPRVAAAQDATPYGQPASGARVRVGYAGESARVGTLIALAPDTVVVRWTDGAVPARLSRARVTQLDVSRGTRPVDRGRRAKYGFYIGAGAGLLIGAVSSGPNEGCYSSSTCDDLVNGLATGIGSLMLGGIGALIGAGSGRASEMWENVPLSPARVSIVLPARDHGAGVGLQLAF